MARKVLVANRGEIVLRVARTCERIGGYEPYAIYSEADKDSLHVRKCKAAVNIGGFSPSDSYLRIDKVIAAAEKLGCDMVHPGYGFLAENAAFSAACRTAGIDFVGPMPSTLELTGDKARSREVASRIAPVLEGGEVIGIDKAEELAQQIGYPVIIKAVRGGGGRGLRVARSEEELQREFGLSQKESLLSFGSDRLYIEKYLEHPRHIEVQVLSDGKDAIHLGERECSVQRRHQKLIEETPSPALNPDMRKELVETATAVMKNVGYQNAGTVEFLFNKGKFYFMEVNARVQVEHPITEQVTGIDIVEQQLNIASGKGLMLKQDDIAFRGHAMECRINAEHPITFAPYPGLIDEFVPPNDGFRIDTAAFPGYSIPPFYDSLIAKLICHTYDRATTIENMKMALQSFRISGIPTTIPFHLSALHDRRFIDGVYDTSFVESLKQFSPPDGERAAAVLSILPRRFKLQTLRPTVDTWMESQRDFVRTGANHPAQGW